MNEVIRSITWIEVYLFCVIVSVGCGYALIDHGHIGMGYIALFVASAMTFHAIFREP